MEWKVEYILEGHMLYVKTKGVLTAESANAMVKEVVMAADCHRCDRQIIDHRETLSLSQYYERPTINATIGISHKWKIAMVFGQLTQDTLFMENVFRNRGYNFRQFDDLEKARAWILEE